MKDNNNIENKYLKNKIEKETVEKEIPKYFNEQIFSHIYKDKEELQVSLGETQLHLSYESFHKIINEKKQYYDLYFKIKSFLIERFQDHDPKIDFDKELINSLKIVKDFSLEKEQYTYKIDKFIQAGYQIIFLPEYRKNERKNASFFNPINKIIFIDDDILTPSGLASLAHELGHLEDFSQMTEEDYNYSLRENHFFFFSPDDLIRDIPRQIRENISASVLKRERDAWYFGLVNIRPFLKDLKIDVKDLILFVHEKGLKTYSNKIKEKFL